MRQGSMTAATGQAYGEPWYWDKRYAEEAGPFDWYQKYPSLKPLLNLYVPPHHRVLIVGCGNSDMKMGTRDMSSFEGGSFDAVVDKGTLDSILCGQSLQQNPAKMLTEVGQVDPDISSAFTYERLLSFLISSFIEAVDGKF